MGSGCSLQRVKSSGFRPPVVSSLPPVSADQAWKTRRFKLTKKLVGESGRLVVVSSKWYEQGGPIASRGAESGREREEVWARGRGPGPATSEVESFLALP